MAGDGVAEGRWGSPDDVGGGGPGCDGERGLPGVFGVGFAACGLVVGFTSVRCSRGGSAGGT